MSDINRSFLFVLTVSFPRSVGQCPIVITSYSIHYTKLYDEYNSGRNYPSGTSNRSVARITSYNVCYTKLLRKSGVRRKMVLVNGVDAHSIEAASQAVDLGLVDVLVTGDKKAILRICAELGIPEGRFEIVHAATEEQAARLALELIAELV